MRPAICLLLVFVISPATFAQESTGSVERDALTNGAEEVRIVLPGRMIRYALPLRNDGGRDLVLLMKPSPAAPEESDEDEEPPPPPPCISEDHEVEPAESLTPEIWAVMYSPDGRLETLSVDVPAGTTSIETIEAPGRPGDDLLLVKPGELRHAAGGVLVSNLEQAMTTDRHRSHLLTGQLAPLFPVTRLGVASFYEASSATTWKEVAEVSVPVRAKRDEGSLRLVSPLLQEVGQPDKGPFLWAVGPEPAGRQRLRTVLINPTAPSDQQSVSVWSRLPEPEKIMASAFAIFDGRPALIVTSRTALKLAIFEEKMLRIFFLDERDRSRTGNLPAYAFETSANLWQPITPFLRDIDGDGREDLVMGYWKGLKDDRVVLDTYLRKPDGSFRTSPRTTEFDVEEGNRSVLGFGEDLDGDGISELLLVAEKQIQIFKGRADHGNGKKLFDKKPHWQFNVSSSRGNSFDINFELGEDLDPYVWRPRWGGTKVVDFDGDGRNELLITDRKEGQAVLRIIKL